MDSLSLYIHIPFCIKKCRYCDFYSVPYDPALADRYLSALSREIDLHERHRAGAPMRIQTLFIGGGTPTVLSARQLAALCGMLRAAFVRAPDLEWTVECNPESFSKEKGGVLLEEGVTRLTFGFQSLDDRDLSLLGRAHDAKRCREILADPVLGSFRSIGIDLMYGLPGQTVESLERSLRTVAESPCVKHLSAYELTVADGTPFGRRRLPLPGDEAMAAMTGRLWALLESHGFRQYEVSNFAKSGHECRHNRICWRHEPYLGLGCAAHSFLPPVRRATVRDVSRYVTEIAEGRLPLEFTETLDAKKTGMEMIFLGLRTVEGVHEEEFRIKTGTSFSDVTEKEKLAALIKDGLLAYEKPFWRPTKKGLLMADALAREIVIF